MRINVYSQELTSEVIELGKVSNTGRVYKAAQLILHSSDHLHHPPEDDDRSAVTFWLPSSQHRREEMARAFERIATIFRYGDAATPRPASQSRAVEVAQGEAVPYCERSDCPCHMALADCRHKKHRDAQPRAVSNDTTLLDQIQNNCWDLRCFDHSDGEDVGWRVIEHHQAEPRERVISEVFEDNPRYAIKQAMLAAAPSQGEPS